MIWCSDKRITAKPDVESKGGGPLTVAEQALGMPSPTDNDGSLSFPLTQPIPVKGDIKVIVQHKVCIVV